MCVDLLTLHTRIMATNWSKGEATDDEMGETANVTHSLKKRGDLRIC